LDWSVLLRFLEEIWMSEEFIHVVWNECLAESPQTGNTWDNNTPDAKLKDGVGNMVEFVDHIINPSEISLQYYEHLPRRYRFF
jgi:hypothetical protein